MQHKLSFILPVKKTLNAELPPHSVDSSVLLLHVYVHSDEGN